VLFVATPRRQGVVVERPVSLVDDAARRSVN
jgi:hypothetical protein